MFKKTKNVLLNNSGGFAFLKKKNIKGFFTGSLGSLFFLNKTLSKLRFYGFETTFFIGGGAKTLYILEDSLFFIKINNLTSLLNTFFVVSKKQFDIQRYKGLGEMNPDQLYHTSMALGFRNITKIYSDSLFKNNLIFENLMGGNVSVRKSFIEKYYNYLQYV
jgi:DNA gyrase/topoisomerase IV subunit B